MTVEKDLCTGCGACAGRCVHGAITLRGEPKRAAVNSDWCIGCGFCQDFCPESAMALVEESSPGQAVTPDEAAFSEE